jgi:DNA-binding transcriptional MerR regulator
VSEPTRRVIIGGQAYDKPWDQRCAACRSPWLGQIDAMLAEGYSLEAIRKHLKGLRPAPPEAGVLRAHIQHLAAPHRKARMDFEEAAESRGEDTATSSARLSDALARLISAGSGRLAAGDLDVSAREMIAAMKLQMQLDRAQAGEGVEASAWQAAYLEFFDLVRKHMRPAQWQAFVADVYDSPAIRQVLASQDPAAIPGGTG